MVFYISGSMNSAIGPNLSTILTATAAAALTLGLLLTLLLISLGLRLPTAVG